MKKKILLAEDDLSVLKVTKARLEHHGFEVLTATDGEDALKKAQSTKKVDLILLDIKMPKLDGFQVCRLLKADPVTAEIPLIVFTASSSRWQKLLEQCVELGITDWLIKPFQSEELLAKIERALSSRS